MTRKPMAHPYRRTVSVLGEPVTLAEAALAVASAVTVTVVGWIVVVIVIVAATP